MLWQPNAEGQLYPLAAGHSCGVCVGHPKRVGQRSTADGLQCITGCVCIVGQIMFTDGCWHCGYWCVQIRVGQASTADGLQT